MPSYDVFICALTEDNETASLIFDFLKSKGVSVFWSTRTVYELDFAEEMVAIQGAATHLVVVASSSKNVNSAFFKEEWRLFLNQKLSGQRTGNLVTVLCRNMKSNQLPRALRENEVLQMTEMETLLRYVSPAKATGRKVADSCLTMPTTADEPIRRNVPEATPSTNEVIEPQWPTAGFSKMTPTRSIFISYSTHDIQYVKKILAPTLRQAGHMPWFSVDGIRASDLWERSILQALEACEWFIVVVSPNSLRSEWVRTEVHWAIENRSSRIVPIMLESCSPWQLHMRLGTIQHVSNPEAEGLGKVLALLE